MPKPERVLELLVERNLNLKVTQDDVELCEINTSDKNIDVIIKNTEEFKKLIKELRG
jgi:hypothetical protein